MRSSNSRVRSAVATLALCAFLPVSLGGCFGGFELTKKTYQFNKEVSPDKWIRWLVFLLITIVPIYGIAMLVDAIAMNSMEFWTGKNPVLAGTERTFHGEDGDVALVRYGFDGVVDVRITRADGSEQQLRLMRAADSVVALDGKGNLIARVGDLDGQPALLAQ
jgi:hypothetical protein